MTGPESLVRAFNEARSTGETDAFVGIVAEDYVADGLSLERLEGPEAVADFYAGIHEAWDDATYTIDDLVVADTTVVSRWRFSGTHVGQFAGVEPTGREVEITALQWDETDGEVITQTTAEVDVLSLMIQLGEFTPPG